jgi:HSP20 family protein
VDFEEMHNEVLRAFNDSCVIATRQQYRGRGFRPEADAFFEEATREIVVRFDLPGMGLDEIELLVDRRELVVRGERRFPAGEGRVYQQVEMDYGPFERRVRLMVDVDPDITTATYEAGILEVRLTLVKRGPGARKIDITTTETTGGEA